MRAIVAVGLVLALACSVAAQDKKDDQIDGKLLVGKWEQVEPKSGPQLTLVFAPNGKLTGTVEIDGKCSTFSGTFKLEGSRLTVVTFVNGNKSESNGRITKLTQDAFEMTDASGTVSKAKRVLK